VDTINEAFGTKRLSGSYSNSFYHNYYTNPIILLFNISFTPALELLFLISLNNDRFVDIYVNNFMNIYLNKTIDRLYEAKRYFNIITNIFDIFFKRAI